ncbi:MAG: DUF1573 domain-containing protein [Acidobacteria bacterium]|nr:DUF1573 domain-containing protein [Acidobacteriota bacterium]
MKLKHTLNLAAICAIWLTLSVMAFAQAANAPAPKIAIKKTDLNLGEVKKGTSANFTFTFKNEGTADLEIKRVAPS